MKENFTINGEAVNDSLTGTLDGRFHEQTSRPASPVFMRVSAQNGTLGGSYLMA